MNQLYTDMLAQIEQDISEINLPDSPSNLYDPVSYIMGLGGKRVRPILTLLGCRLFSGTHNQAIPQALAIEVFHNFTLVHDDVMDSADLRRGLPTVHKKWSHNIALLSGDAMLVLAYQLLLDKNHADLHQISTVFSKVAMDVCEGQQLDMDYAERIDVSMTDYLDMIRKKTAVLLSGSLQIGAIIGGGQNLEPLATFAESLGLAFQVKDDYLDAFGSDEFGKAKGGDIIEGKRTWLTIKSYELADDSTRIELDDAFALEDESDRIRTVLDIYQRLNIEALAEAEVVRYSQAASNSLLEIEGDQDTKETMTWLVDQLVGRTT
jgi:geranylgeranyl diphosphate synthase, type II